MMASANKNITCLDFFVFKCFFYFVGISALRTMAETLSIAATENIKNFNFVTISVGRSILDNVQLIVSYRSSDNEPILKYI